MLEVSKKIIKATFLIYNELGPVVKKILLVVTETQTFSYKCSHIQKYMHNFYSYKLLNFHMEVSNLEQ